MVDFDPDGAVYCLCGAVLVPVEIDDWMCPACGDGYLGTVDPNKHDVWALVLNVLANLGIDLEEWA